MTYHAAVIFIDSRITAFSPFKGTEREWERDEIKREKRERAIKNRSSAAHVRIEGDLSAE